ncbi:MAG: acylphosphatase [Chlamydiales bacterium]|nr:acylphosphatase [Chlamydiales bacterium]
MVKELHAIIRGRVQGVGFRWTVVDYAESHRLTGTTKNLPDGTVEIYAQGPKESLEALLEDLKNDSGFARIESIKSEYRDPSRSFKGFKII